MVERSVGQNAPPGTGSAGAPARTEREARMIFLKCVIPGEPERLRRCAGEGARAPSTWLTS